MTETQWLERMREAARGDRPPAIDVVPGVMRQLRTARPSVEGPLAIMTALSAVAAIVVVALATHAWSEFQDPFSAMLNSINLVLQ